MTHNIAASFRTSWACRLFSAGMVVVSTMVAGPTHAAAYPNKPITVIVPFPAGGSVDTMMRILAPHLSQELHQTIVVENAGGAGGAIGAGRAAKEDSDGYTLLAGSNNDMVMAPVLNENVTYRASDFVPVSMLISSTPMLVARADLPQSSLDEVIEQLRAKPQSLSYGSPGYGTMQHVVVEELQQKAGVRMLHVPYKGSAPLINDLLGGQVDMAVMVPSTAVQHLKSGRIKALGISQAKRLKEFPDVPVFNESKYLDDVEMIGWVGLFAPAGLADDRQQKLALAVQAALSNPDVQQRLSDIGMEAADAEQQKTMAERVKQDTEKVRGLNLKFE